ncbi:hypothetical protein FQR65_LT15898 [Abscondita terminalis]|nr:hypothetical protein FQR65_LT15898 [Abscondita terminalis]
MSDNELKALISLLDDPDTTIFEEIEQKLITCGPEGHPLLESSWESSFDVLMQTRIENIIHKIQFDQIKNELQDFGLSGNTANYHDPQNSYLNKVLESKKGNPITLACIYCVIAQRLDIPIYGVNLPKHFVLAYMNEETTWIQSPCFNN